MRVAESASVSKYTYCALQCVLLQVQVQVSIYTYCARGFFLLYGVVGEDDKLHNNTAGTSLNSTVVCIACSRVLGVVKTRVDLNCSRACAKRWFSVCQVCISLPHY